MDSIEEEQVKPVEVLLVVDIEALSDRALFEKQLKREGFTPIPDAPFSYFGETTTHKINTVLYIHSAVKRALVRAGFARCKIIFQIGEYPMEGYRYDLQQEVFVPAEM